MAKFTAEQATSWIAIQQLINDWAYDLDGNNGLNVPSLVTEECNYKVRAVSRTSRADVEAFYKQRLQEFADAGKEPPLQRHVQSNLRVQFSDAVKASITFTLVYFTDAMMAAGADAADPTAVADVVMDVECCEDGHWRIAKFDSVQCLVRAAR